MNAKLPLQCADVEWRSLCAVEYKPSLRRERWSRGRVNAVSEVRD